jgi:pantetheine-phosphate adenylyltransferase
MSVIIPGSYDPVTLGHLDIIRRASEIYDEVYAVVFINPEKKYEFSLEQRVSMLMLATDGLPNVLVSYSNGLVIDYMREHGIEKIIKGYRNDTDLEYERKQARWNLCHGGFETELWRASCGYESISSTLVREKIKRGESAADLLPPGVEEYIKSQNP